MLEADEKHETTKQWPKNTVITTTTKMHFEKLVQRIAGQLQKILTNPVKNNRKEISMCINGGMFRKWSVNQLEKVQKLEN